jgi:secondary thiamine-phosphate synthase enzyme
MKIHQDTLNIQTKTDIDIYDLTSDVQRCVDISGISEGQALIFSRHTTTALAINEYEQRLLVDIKTYLRKLAPEGDRYLHNDLHLRDVPDDEPENAHAHLMAMTLHNHEVVPVIQGKLALGTYQSILFLELDDPRHRTVSVQISGVQRSDLER